MIDDLLKKEYWVIDILPKQVLEDSGGQYFNIEKYYLNRNPLIGKMFVNIILKLNCYYDIGLSNDGNNWVINPLPDILANGIESCMSVKYEGRSLFVLLKSENALFVIDNDCTYMTLYNPTSELLELVRLLVSSEGLFIWKPCC